MILMLVTDAAPSFTLKREQEFSYAVDRSNTG